MATVVLSLVTAHAFADERSVDIRVGYLFSDGQTPVTLQAYRTLFEQHPELRERVELTILSESTFDEVEAERLLSAQVLVYDVMNEQMLARFDDKHDADLLAQVNQNGTVVGVGQGLMSDSQYADRGVHWDERARAFWGASGTANHTGLAALALEYAGVEGLTVPEPESTLAGGYYHSDSGGQVFADWEAFDAWRAAHGKHRPGAPRVAIGFYRANYYGNEMAIVDALIAEIERQGGEAIPFFGYPGHAAMQQYLVDDKGNARADVVLGLLFRFAQPDMASTLSTIDVPIINAVTLYGRSSAEWEASPTGLSLFEGTFQVAAPELAGLIAPTVVGSRERAIAPETGVPAVFQTPIAPRVRRAVDRALNLAALAAKPNADKRLAVFFYNYPAGAAGIGASYLNVAGSLANLFNRLVTEGYTLGQARFEEDVLLEQLTSGVRNIAGYAPGELAAIAAEKRGIKVPLQRYQEWLAGMDNRLVAKVNADWGPPGDETLMFDVTDRAFFVPALQFGNVVLLPQPARGWGEDDQQLYHADDLAPHHQYVATYAWLKNDFGADAVLHIGTHGTLEWLDGKDVGLSDADAPEALISALPHVYPYNVDVVGEGLVARRRSAATLIDHMVPPFVKGGVYAELAELSERVDSYHRNLRKNPELAAEYASDIYALVEELGISDDLELNLTQADEERALEHGFEAQGEHGSDETHYADARGASRARVIDHDVIHTLQAYIADMKSQNIPYGLHALGRLPVAEARASTVDAVVSIDRSLIGNEVVILKEEMDERIVASAQLELSRTVHALQGGYVPGGTGGEPIRNPDAYPTGKNFFGIDPDKVPTKAAWRLGTELASTMLTRHMEANGSYPDKVSFVIWGDETIRHEGVLESQIFHLLGTRPVWDARDKVVDVEVIPRAELNRPRVDIVIASAAEGMFHNVTMLMDRAVQRVKELDEPDNAVRRHYLETRQTLIDFGYEPKLAERHAGVRIFDEAPGTFNLNVSRIAEASGTWETDVGMAHDYLKKMGHGYGNGFWGEPMEDVFRLALSGTETIVHSSSTMLYGGLDNDDFYMYMGGLANAVKSVDGETPMMTVTNTRDPSKPAMTGINEFLGTEMRTRYFNPTWIEGMQTEGYAGAGEMRAFVEYLWGWDATASNTVNDRDWEEVYGTYVEDVHELSLEAFFDEHSPPAYQDMTARMLEVTRKGYWDASAEIRENLAREFMASVARNGFSCSGNTCGNPRLLEYLLQQAAAAGVDPAEIEAFEQDVESRMQTDLQTAAAEDAAFAKANEERIRRRNALIEDGMDPAMIEAYEVGDADQAPTRPAVLESPALATWWPVPVVLISLLLAFLAFRRRPTSR